MTNVRKAACVVLCRRRLDGTREVLLVKRAISTPFLGNYHVFPGGTVDENDISDVDTAVRELREETGIVVAPETLKFLTHWKTPAFSVQQFEAAYFVAELDANDQQRTTPCGQEIIEAVWLTPDEARHRHHAGTIFLSYPVLDTLAHLDDPTVPIGSSYPHSGGEVAGGVYCVPGKTDTLPPATHTNTYILGGADLVIVDPATPYEPDRTRLLDFIRHLQSQGATVREVWLTHHHTDHIGAVEWLCSTLHVPLAAHPKTFERLRLHVPETRMILDGDINILRGPGGEMHWRASHTPGHAPGHLCFIEDRIGLLLSGDNVLGLGSVLIAAPDGDMRLYLQSLKMMQAWGARMLFPAHGPPQGDPYALIERYIQHRMLREASIVAVLCAARQALTPDDIVPQVYRDIPEALYPLAALNVRSHLDKLRYEGTVIEEASDLFRSTERAK